MFEQSSSFEILPGKAGGFARIQTSMTEERIKIGISRCLLGDKVRYDGGHKKDRYLTDTLSKYLDYIPVCPEVEAGFPVPREAFRLVGNFEKPAMIASKTKKDVTQVMKNWAKK